MATAHSEAEEARNDNPNELEATELHDYQDEAQSRPTSSTITAMDDNAGTGELAPLPGRRRSIADMIGKFWKRHVVVTVSHEACRDHFGRFCIKDQVLFRVPVLFSSSNPFCSSSISYLLAICTG